MADLPVSTMGYKIVLQRPEDNDAYDQKAGVKNAACEDASESVAYRSTLPAIHAAALPELQILFGGAEREVNQKATDAAKARSDNPEKVKPTLETIPAYVKRNTAGFTKEQQEEVRQILQRAADANPVDPTPATRQRGPAKDLLAKADQILTLPEDQREAKITSWLGQVEGFDLERDDENVPTRESLALLIGELVKQL
jgi:hypothetical protein